MAEASVKLGVSGVSQFKQGMADAQASVKSLDAALKYNEKAAKSSANAEMEMYTKLNLLNGKLKEQGNIARNAEQALKHMEANGVKPTSKAYQDMQRQMIEAKSAMLDTEQQIQELGTASVETAEETDKLVDSLGGLNKKVSLEQVTSAIGHITNGLENAARRAIELGEKIFSSIVESAAQADDISTLATQLGLTDEEVQQINYNAARFEVTAEQLGKTWKKVKVNMNSDSQEIIDAFEELGVRTHDVLPGKFGDVNQNARDYKDVFWEIGDALLRMDDASRQEALAQKLLGRSWDELLPLFTKGREAYEAALKVAPTASDEAIESLADFNDRLKELEQSWDTLKLEILGKIAPALEKGADAIATMLNSLIEYLKTEDGKKALEDMGKAVEGLFSDLSQIDPEKVVEGFSKVFTDIVSGLQWLAGNSGTVIDAMKAIVLGWAGLKLTGGALEILKMLNGIKDLSGGKYGNVVTGGSGADTDTQGNTGRNTPRLTNEDKYSLLDLVTLAAAAKAVSDAIDPNKTESGKKLSELNKRLNSGELTQDEAMWEVLEHDYGPEHAGELMSMWNKPSESGPAASILDYINAAKNYWSEKLPNGFWSLFGFESAEDAAMKVMGFLQQTGENMHVAEDWTLGDEYSADELMALINGEEPAEVPVEPVVEDDAAAEIEKQIGHVQVVVDLVTNGLGIGSDEGGGSSGGHGFANGIWSVPFDGYAAILHKGERVTPAREVGSSRNFSSNLYVESMYMNNGMDASALATSMAAAQRRTMKGFGS